MDITRFLANQRDKALLVGDHSSYRKQLSRRLLVVRKKLNYSSRGRKYTPQAPITAEDIAGNHESVAAEYVRDSLADCHLDSYTSYFLPPSGLGRWPCI